MALALELALDLLSSRRSTDWCCTHFPGCFLWCLYPLPFLRLLHALLLLSLGNYLMLSLLFQEHLLIVCELLKANLYEFHKFNRESGGEVYFTMPRLQVCSVFVIEFLTPHVFSNFLSIYLFSFYPLSL